MNDSVGVERLELSKFHGPKPCALPFGHTPMEQITRIKLVLNAWKAFVLPLHQICIDSKTLYPYIYYTRYIEI